MTTVRIAFEMEMSSQTLPTENIHSNICLSPKVHKSMMHHCQQELKMIYDGLNEDCSINFRDQDQGVICFEP